MAIDETVVPGESNHAQHHRDLAVKANELDALTSTGRLSEAELSATYAPLLAHAGPLLGKLDRNAEDAGLLIISDSTGADPAAETRWVRQVVDGLADRYPTHTVTLYNWVSETDVLGSAVSIQTGTGSRTLTVHNISDSGAAASTFLADFTNRTPGNPDLVLVSLGLNESSSSFPSFHSGYVQLCKKIANKFPGAGLALVAQNPKRTAATDANDQLVIRGLIQQVASREGYGFLDVAGEFLGTPAWETDLMLGGGDNTHPSQDGYDTWAAFVLAAMSHRPTAPTALLRPTLDRVFLPASAFAPTTGSPVITAVADGLVGYGFDATTREVVSSSVFTPPESWAKFNVYLYWSSGNPGGSTGAVQWELSTFPGVADRTTYPSARGSATVVGNIRTSETVPSTGESGYVRRLDWTVDTSNEFTARGSLMLAVARRGDNTGADTLGIDAVFLGLEFVRVK